MSTENKETKKSFPWGTFVMLSFYGLLKLSPVCLVLSIILSVMAGMDGGDMPQPGVIIGVGFGWAFFFGASIALLTITKKANEKKEEQTNPDKVAESDQIDT